MPSTVNIENGRVASTPWATDVSKVTKLGQMVLDSDLSDPLCDDEFLAQPHRAAAVQRESAVSPTCRRHAANVMTGHRLESSKSKTATRWCVHARARAHVRELAQHSTIEHVH